MQTDIPLEIKEIFCGCGGRPSSREFFNTYDDGALIHRTTIYQLPLTKQRMLIAAPGMDEHHSWSLFLESYINNQGTASPVLVEMCSGEGIGSQQLLDLCNLLENT